MHSDLVVDLTLREIKSGERHGENVAEYRKGIWSCTGK